ncbi:hypothetical protein C0993_011425 [Termitomyces sp. T159_Od127]|nr:hypothetical protein C0993_011425 [Termitomyces sp. T159_Od127]
MIVQLWSLSQAAKPTAFHNALRALDDRGKLLRVYTQNIDAIEEKSGLSFGVPEFEDRRYKGRTKITITAADCVIKESSAARKRARGVGKLRPSVVLYNEAHKDGEGVGEVVKKDLIGSSKGKGRSGADLLLVVGTSLRVPGTKRMVREFAKAVRSRGIGSSRNSPSPASSPRPSPAAADEESSMSAMKAIYLNHDFPVPTREWEGVFDAWIQGDAQEFANLLQEEIEREARAKQLVLERKKKREGESTQVEQSSPKTPTKAQPKANSDAKTAKRKLSSPSVPSAKKRKIQFPQTPPKTPSLKLCIPARPAIPEVVITSHLPILSYQNTAGAGAQQLPTPEKSPPVRRKYGLSPEHHKSVTSHIESAQSDTTHLFASVRQNAKHTSSSDFSDEEQDADAHVLPEIRRNTLYEIEVA